MKLGRLWRAALALSRASIPALLLGGIVTCVVSGCTAREDATVLRVGPESVTLGQFEERFWRAVEAAAGGAAGSDSAAARLRPDTTGVRVFSERLVEELLTGLLAKKHAPELEAERLERIEEYKELNMVEALRKRRYGDVKPSERDLRRAYELMARRLDLRMMLLDSEREAADIRGQIQQGASFPKVAEARSLDLNTRHAGGALGWISYLDLDAAVRDDVFTLRRGELSRPLLVDRYVYLFQVVDEQPNDGRGTFEEERARLEIGVRTSLSRRAQIAYREELFRKYNFKMDPAEVAWMTVLMREKTRGANRGENLTGGVGTAEELARLQNASVPWTTSPIPLADTSRVLATFDPPDGVVGPFLFLDQLLSHAVPTWPKFESSRDTEDLLRELALERFEIREARAEKIDQSPEYVASVRERMEEARVRQFRRRHLVERMQPSEDELRAWYQRQISRYSTPEKRRFIAFGSRDLARSEEVARLLRSGADAGSIEARFAAIDTSFESTGARGTPFLQRGQSPLLDDVLFALPLDAVSDPIDIGGRYTVAKVIEIAPRSERAFEEVRSEIENRVRNEMADRELAAMLVAARTEFPVTIDRRVLARVRPVRPAS